MYFLSGHSRPPETRTDRKETHDGRLCRFPVGPSAETCDVECRNPKFTFFLRGNVPFIHTGQYVIFLFFGNSPRHHCTSQPGTGKDEGLLGSFGSMDHGHSDLFSHVDRLQGTNGSWHM